VYIREGAVVDVIHRLSVELLRYFLYDVGCVGSILVRAGGVGGSGFFVIDLGGGQVGLKVGPRFVGRLFLILFFNGVSKDACVTEDSFSYADKLRVGFRGAMRFR